jgi:Ca2+-binding EF-hand superfamily protein
MKLRTQTLFLAVAGALALAGAHAQTTPPRDGPTATAADPAALFRQLDVTRRGKLSRAEVANVPQVADRFAELDRDKDGFLTPAEFSAAFMK